MKRELLVEETVQDFFELLEKDPKQGSISYVYYVGPLRVNKKFVDTDGEKKINPYEGKLFKVTRFMFNYGETYGARVRKLDPDYEFKQRKGVYEKPAGYSAVEMGKSGLYLPILPKGSKSQYILLDGGRIEKIDLKDYQKYLPPPSGGSSIPPTDFRNLILDRIYKISAGGHVWENPNFAYPQLQKKEHLLEEK